MQPEGNDRPLFRIGTVTYSLRRICFSPIMMTTTRSGVATIHPFLSLPWMEAYAAHCSKDAELVQSLKGFTALIEYGWLDAPLPSVYLHMRDGLPQGIMDSPAQKVNMRVHARTDIWQRIYHRDISAKKALLIHELKFKGSMLTLLKYMDPINATFRRMGDVPATFES